MMNLISCPIPFVQSGIELSHKQTRFFFPAFDRVEFFHSEKYANHNSEAIPIFFARPFLFVQVFILMSKAFKSCAILRVIE